MGLAPYGDFTKCKGVLDKYYPKFSNGRLVEAHDFGTPFLWSETGATEFHFDEAYAIAGIVEKHGRENVAAEAQRVLEEQVMSVIFPWMERERTKNLCCSGGVFLNVKLNQRLWYSGKVEKHFVYPNCGDSGLAHGAALECFYRKASTVPPIGSLEHLYWGPEYSDETVVQLVKDRNLRFKVCDDVETVVAELLAKNNIV
jgi:carbamoyltransferase